LLSGLLIVCGAAVAQDTRGYFMDGNNLYSQLNDKHLELAVGGYVTGIIDTVTNLTESKALTISLFCVPTQATIRQVTDVVKKYLADHPENRHFAASSVVMVALGEAFPCKPGRTK
jgi:hypothetical protein